MSNYLWPCGVQHTRLPCPSLSSGVCSNSRPLGQWCYPTIYPLFPPSLSAFNLSHHLGLFQWVDFPHHVAKVLELRFSISPSNEYSGLITFRIDWFNFPAVQGTLKSLLQHHSLKASIHQYVLKSSTINWPETSFDWTSILLNLYSVFG